MTKKNLLVPDLGNLHIELRDHAKHVLHWCRKEADARRDLAQAKDQMELTEADVSLKIRSRPDKYLKGIKATEDTIKMAVRKHPNYQDAQNLYIRAKHLVDTIHAMVEALSSQKKMVLENEVILHGRGYWREPNVRDRELREDVRDRKNRMATKRVRSG